MVTELGNEHTILAIAYSLEVGVTCVVGFPWGQEDTSAFSLGPAPESKLQPHRKVFGQSPLSDSSPKAQTPENLPTSILECASSGKTGLPSWAFPLVLHAAKSGPYFTPEVAAFQEQSVIKKDGWRVISFTNTCTVRGDLFGRKEQCKSKIITV